MVIVLDYDNGTRFYRYLRCRLSICQTSQEMMCVSFSKTLQYSHMAAWPMLQYYFEVNMNPTKLC